MEYSTGSKYKLRIALVKRMVLDCVPVSIAISVNFRYGLPDLCYSTLQQSTPLYRMFTSTLIRLRQSSQSILVAGSVPSFRCSFPF
jgi:hypothetical protein